jgi:hypothetical protein
MYCGQDDAVHLDKNRTAHSYDKAVNESNGRSLVSGCRQHINSKGHFRTTPIDTCVSTACHKAPVLLDDALSPRQE